VANHAWVKGQQAVINRQVIVTIEKVTSAGRAVVNGSKFNSDGTEFGSGRWAENLLEPLTPEIEAEMAMRERGKAAYRQLKRETDVIAIWLRNTFYRGGAPIPLVPALADIEKAERLAAAIKAIMEEPGDGH
jgi:hypothetical protein